MTRRTALALVVTFAAGGGLAAFALSANPGSTPSADAATQTIPVQTTTVTRTVHETVTSQAAPAGGATSVQAAPVATPAPPSAAEIEHEREERGDDDD